VLCFLADILKLGGKNPFPKPGNTDWQGVTALKATLIMIGPQQWAQNTCFAKPNLPFTKGSHAHSLYIDNP